MEKWRLKLTSAIVEAEGGNIRKSTDFPYFQMFVKLFCKVYNIVFMYSSTVL